MPSRSLPIALRLWRAATRRLDDLPENILGRTREHIKGVRRRYDFLFGLILNAGLRPAPHGAREVLGPPVRLRALADGRI